MDYLMLEKARILHVVKTATVPRGFWSKNTTCRDLGIWGM